MCDLERPFCTSRHHLMLCAIRGVPFVRHPVRSAKIGGTPDMERPCGRIRARTASRGAPPHTHPCSPHSPAHRRALRHPRRMPVATLPGRSSPSPASMCKRRCAKGPSQIARCAKGTSQIAHRKGLSVPALYSYVQFGTSLLHIGWDSCAGKRACRRPPRAPTGARHERAARQGRSTARRPSPGRGRRGAKGHPWGTRGGLSPDPFGDVRKGQHIARGDAEMCEGDVQKGRPKSHIG